MAQTYGLITFHGRPFRVTPGAVTALARDPDNIALAYELLRLEGYPAAELEALAQPTLLPVPHPAAQLPLFDLNASPWRS